jgi:hypothetical protein
MQMTEFGRNCKIISKAYLRRRCETYVYRIHGEAYSPCLVCRTISRMLRCSKSAVSTSAPNPRRRRRSSWIRACSAAFEASKCFQDCRKQTHFGSSILVGKIRVSSSSNSSRLFVTILRENAFPHTTCINICASQRGVSLVFRLPREARKFCATLACNVLILLRYSPMLAFNAPNFWRVVRNQRYAS